MKTLPKYILLFTTLLASFLYSDEEKRIEPGSRKLTKEQKNEIAQIEKQEYTLKKKLISDVYNNQYPPLIFDHAHHNLIGISALGDYVIIEDGSQWNIKPNNTNEAFFWKETDPIIIVKNDSFISSHLYGYKYKMINAKTNNAIEVKLHLGPILNNPYTLQIIAINPITYEIILSDNTLWKCDPSQYYFFNKWLPNDGIIIGTNVKGWFNTYDNILINVNLLQEIRANRTE